MRFVGLKAQAVDGSAVHALLVGDDDVVAIHGQFSMDARHDRTVEQSVEGSGLAAFAGGFGGTADCDGEGQEADVVGIIEARQKDRRGRHGGWIQ